MGEPSQSCKSEAWAVQIDKILRSQSRKRYPSIPRISPILIKSNEGAYIPQVVCLGPYYHHLKSDKLQYMENRKIFICGELIRGNELTKDFADVVREVKGMCAGIRLLYATQSVRRHDDHSLALMLTLDAFFILDFLKYLEDKGWSYANAPMTSFQFHILRDATKLQNQLPLSVLSHVQKLMKPLSDDKYKELLQHACVNLSPFHFEEKSERKVELEGDRHFLESLCKYVSAFLVIIPEEQSKRVFAVCEYWMWTNVKFVLKILALPLYVVPLLFFLIIEIRRPLPIFSKFPRVCSAVELHQVGVSFKALSSDADQIAFRGSTLYLPTIMISEETTEVILRNLVAFEAHNLEDQHKVVTAYVDLMDTLIDTAEDVALLRRCGIIHRHYGNLNDQDIARMWNNLSNAFFAGYFDPPRHLAARIRETARKKESLYKDYWEEFEGRYLSRPWLTASFVAGILILFMTASQVLCLFYKCMK